MSLGKGIVLAHEPDLVVGPVTLVPSSRELIAPDGQRHVLEPRVMQVLVALARAEGAVVSKDDLLATCWEGRVVGEDAINRVLSRLRRVAEDEAGGAFRIETITRVGYRLIVGGAASAPASQPAKPGYTRRTALAGLALVAAGGLGGGALWLTNRRSGEAIELERQARDGLDYGTPEQLGVAISALRRLTALEPERAANWSLLALAYGQQGGLSAQGEALFARAREARQRALALDPDDPDANLAGLIGTIFYKRWSAYDRDAKRLLARFPDNPRLNLAYAFFEAQTGRGAAAYRRFAAVDPKHRKGPFHALSFVLMLRGQNLLDQADAEMNRAIAAYPQHFGVWFTRSRYLIYTGRASEALAMLGEGYPKPTGIPAWNFALSASEARAVLSRSPEDIADTEARYAEAMKVGTGFIQNAIIFAAAMGRVDSAFALTERFYGGAGSGVQRRYSQEQAVFALPEHRPTHFLFSPETAALRDDPRFKRLIGALGLEDYWRQIGVEPDYRRKPAAASIPA